MRQSDCRLLDRLVLVWLGAEQLVGGLSRPVNQNKAGAWHQWPEATTRRIFFKPPRY